MQAWVKAGSLRVGSRGDPRRGWAEVPPLCRHWDSCSSGWARSWRKDSPSLGSPESHSTWREPRVLLGAALGSEVPDPVSSAVTGQSHPRELWQGPHGCVSGVPRRQRLEGGQRGCRVTERAGGTGSPGRPCASHTPATLALFFCEVACKSLVWRVATGDKTNI